MNKQLSLLAFALLAAGLSAQTLSIYPNEYSAVAEGPFNSPNQPLAAGTGRSQFVYEVGDLAIPSGHTITRLGYRQDGTLTTQDTGRTLQLEVRIGYTSLTAATLGTNFANNYVAPPVTVFGPAAFTLPNLREVANPLPNGRFFLPLTTPFVYTPANGNLIVEYLVYGNSGGGTSFNYRLDRSDFYSPVTYGPAGCPRAGGGTPNLTANGLRPGQTYSTSLATGPGSSFGFLLIAPGTQLLPPTSLQLLVPGINPACTNQVSLVGPTQLSAVTSAAGAASWSFTLPNNAAWADYYFTSQAAFFDFFAPGGVVVSNGAQVLTGALPRCSYNFAAGPPATAVTGTVTRNYNPITFFEHQ
jgi:hypothetical protein